MWASTDSTSESKRLLQHLVCEGKPRMAGAGPQSDPVLVCEKRDAGAIRIGDVAAGSNKQDGFRSPVQCRARDDRAVIHQMVDDRLAPVHADSNHSPQVRFITAFTTLSIKWWMTGPGAQGDYRARCGVTHGESDDH